MAKQSEDDELNDLEALISAAGAKGKAGQTKGSAGGNQDELLGILEINAAQSLLMAYKSNPRCVNSQSLDPQLAKSAGAQPEHAWGQPQADGAVQLPSGFEQVTNLGPVIIVCAQQEKSHADALVVYRDGFAYQPAGKAVQAWRFDQVAGIQTKLETFRLGGTREYTLTRAAGPSADLDEVFFVRGLSNDDRVKVAEAMEAAGDQIKLAVFRLLLPAMLQRYQAGEALKFGPVTVQQKDGLQSGSHRYAWGDIQNIEVNGGLFKITLSNGKRDEIRVPEIPNLELLARLIGVDLYSLQEGMRAYK